MVDVFLFLLYKTAFERHTVHCMENIYDFVAINPPGNNNQHINDEMI